MTVSGRVVSQAEEMLKKSKPQVPLLRFAPVGMTREGVTVDREQLLSLIENGC